MMHANQQSWSFHQSNNNNINNNAYGADDDDEEDATAIIANDEDFGRFGVGGDLTSAGRRYLTVQPKQWCTSYVATNRQPYIHSTESAANHNGVIGLENDVYSGIGSRTTADFFRSKTMPRRTAAGNMMDDYNYGNGNDSDGNVTGVSIRTGGGHQWPTSSSADIVEYDSSVAADTPALQQQHAQFLLPQQQQQRQRTNKFSHKSDVTGNSNAANYGGGKSSIMSAAADDSAGNGGSKFKWKRRALYVFLACLLAVVVVNLTLTLWFIRVTQFTSEGMGSLKITNGGLKLSGRTLVTNRLVASAIRSRVGRPLLVESTANITLNTRNAQGRMLNSLRLTKDSLECAQADVFSVTNHQGKTLFSAERKKVIVGAEELHVTGSGGAVFQGSVQTPLVRADPRHDLRLESASRRLELSGPQGVTIESRAGDITVSCLMDVKLQSISGGIQIDAARVFFKGLKTAKTSTANPATASTASSSASGFPAGHHNSVGRGSGVGDGSGSGKRGVEDKLPSVYQLCVCGNGKVFMSPPDGQCAADNESLVCR